MQNIKRSEFKYWIIPEYVDELADQIQKYLPAYTYLGGPVLTQISSVFLDSAKMEAYRSRLVSSDEAIFIRLRWYGAFNDGPIFVEGKKKLGRFQRLKARFSLDPTDVHSFLQGIPCCEKIADQSIDNLEEAVMLCSEMQSLIVTEHLYPRLHIQYRRRAFQSAEDENVRLTLETYIEMKSAEGFPVVSPETEVYHFPFAVLEVKLEGSEPEWVGEILQHPEIITTYPDFSKFIHGMAVVFRADQLSLPLPSWPLLLQST